MVSVSLEISESIGFTTHPYMNMHCILSRRKAYVIIETEDNLNIVYEILDEDRDEMFLTCEFAESKYPILIIGTKNGVLKVFDISKYEFKYFLKGHGGAVNDLKVHTIKKNIIFSASDDFTVRMWDTIEKRTLAIFGGIAGHRDVVLSLDVSLCGKHLLTSSNDCTIKIWKIPDATDGIVCVYFPVFSSSEIHRSFITCAKFYGQFVVSKGRKNRIVVFMPNFDVEISHHKNESDVLFIEEFNFEKTGDLNNRFSIYNNSFVIGSKEKKDEIYYYNFKNLGKTNSVMFCKSNSNMLIREITVKNGFFYILYVNGIFERLIHREDYDQGLLNI